MNYRDGVFEADVAELSLEITRAIARRMPVDEDTGWAVMTALMLAMLDEIDELPPWDAEQISRVLVDEFAMRAGLGAPPSCRPN